MLLYNKQAFEMLAVEVDFVLAGEALGRGRSVCIYPHLPVGDDLAFTVGHTSFGINRNV